MSEFGSGIRRLCAVAAAPTAAEMAAQARAALGVTPTVELRLDWLRSDRERARFLACLRGHRSGDVTFVATCRRLAGGGRFTGSVQGELHWLAQARQAECLWCDIEIESLCKMHRSSLREYAVPSCVLLSLHDFRRTPALAGITRARKNDGIAAIKIAAHARTIADSLRLLRWARSTQDGVAIPMGEVALPARVLALRQGSALTYAPVGEATAPGQVSLEQMKSLYRAHELTKRTQIYGVIGDPIGHSLSPILHNTGFISRKIDAVLLPFLVRDLPDFLRAVPELGIRGFAVTIPHKQDIIKHLRHCDPLAAEIGAVNSVRVAHDGSQYGYNTDYIGVLRSLERRLHLKRSRVLIFGAGGSARAAAFALAGTGAQVAICARREGAARELARATKCEVIPRRALRTESFDAILNTTPIGMYPLDGASPLESGELNCRLVMDFIYRPEKTHLLQLAARKDIATISGVEMFLAQGIAQWELWMKRRATEAGMRRAVLAALRAQVQGKPTTSRGKR